VKSEQLTDTRRTAPAMAISGDVKVSWKEKFSYGLGDTACNIVVALTASILTFFYTDYIGISVGTVGIIILVSRLFDGASDVVMGLIVDRTHSKYGKARPWVLWMSVPYAIGCVLLFTVPPHASDMVKAIYIFITYNFIQTVCYTALNLPYSSLATLMTRNQYERGVINAIRMGLSPFGRILATAATLPLVKVLGDDQEAWIMAAVLYGIIALILLLICFFNTKERVKLEKNTDSKVPVRTSLKALIKNKYWALGLLLWAMLSVYMTLSGTMLSYYSKWILGDALLTSPLYIAEQVPGIAIIFLIPALLKRFSKRNLALGGAIISIVGQVPLVIDPTSYTLAMMASVFRGIGQAPLMGVVFSFIADSVEYGQWKTHLRLEGLIYSAASVGSKLGGGLTSATLGLILSAAGYDGMLAMQSDAAIGAIIDLFVWGPIVVWGVTALILLFHKLEKFYPVMMKDLAERESHGEL
jgi:GPH family glycoside/pentoside/hexuronide:cation symporter